MWLFLFIALQATSRHLSMLTKAKMFWKPVYTNSGKRMRMSKPAANKVKASLENSTNLETYCFLVTDCYQWACETCKVSYSSKMRKHKSAKLKQNLQATLFITALDSCVFVVCYFSQAMNFACTEWSSGPVQEHHFPTLTPWLTIFHADSYAIKPFTLCRMYGW